MARPNLKVRSDTLVLKIEFRQSRAVGVVVANGNATTRLMADREVILAAGAINSPQLLQLSGVGDAQDLRALGIPVVAHIPEVGRNLQDHPCIYIQHKCLTSDSLASALSPLRKAAIGMRWLLSRSGLGASNHFEVGGFIRTRANVEHPDLQYHFMALAIGYEDRGRRLGPSYQVDADILRPKSRGRIAIASSDPTAAPRIDPNYLSEEADRRFFIDAVHRTREIFSQHAFARFRGDEILPGPGITTAQEIGRYVSETAESAYHPSCTCRMGSDAEAVVNPECKVNGIQSLRVVDASIMPSIVSGNLYAPTVMLAEKASDMILGKPPLESEKVPYYVSARWRESQK